MQHYVIFKFRDEQDCALLAGQMQESMKKLPESVPGLNGVKVFANSNVQRASNMDIMIRYDFDSLQDLGCFLNSPAHAKISGGEQTKIETMVTFDHEED